MRKLKLKPPSLLTILVILEIALVFLTFWILASQTRTDAVRDTLKAWGFPMP